MFGVSLGELGLIALVTLLVVGPKQLPAMLRSLGEWMRKLRAMTTEVRAQTGIDEILRAEGIEGGLSELRSMLRGDLAGIVRGPEGYRAPHDSEPLPDLAVSDPYAEAYPHDRSREYPPEGVDAAGVLPDDLYDEPPLPVASPRAPDAGTADP